MARFKEDKVRKLSSKYGVDARVVRMLVDYPLLFSRNKIADDTDYRPIRIRYFATFQPKGRYNGETKDKEQEVQSIQD